MSYMLWVSYFCQVAEEVSDVKLRAVLIFIALLISLLIFQILIRIKFKNKQLEYYRVSEAVKEKEDLIREYFKEGGVVYPPRCIFIRAFKEDKVVELWAKSRNQRTYAFIKSYEISSISGNLGPKRQEGDKQIPEGFYYIDRFNPSSKFYLSLGLNYPNESDCILGNREKLGGDIFIHGGISTVGCIPITDDKIKELYVIALEAVSKGQDRIPVHIFPKRLDEEGMKEIKQRFENNPNLILFWENIKKGFDKFELNRIPPKITVDMNGKYIIQ